MIFIECVVLETTHFQPSVAMRRWYLKDIDLAEFFVGTVCRLDSETNASFNKFCKFIKARIHVFVSLRSSYTVKTVQALIINRHNGIFTTILDSKKIKTLD